MILTMDYKRAMAAAEDAANRQMLKDGHIRWTEDHWNLAVKVFEQCMGSSPND